MILIKNTFWPLSYFFMVNIIVLFCQRSGAAFQCSKGASEDPREGPRRCWTSGAQKGQGDQILGQAGVPRRFNGSSKKSASQQSHTQGN